MRFLIALIALIATTMTTPADAREVGEMLPLLQRHEIQVLLSAGLAPADVARRVGVSVDTVQRVGREGPVAHVDDDVERRRRRVGRPPKVTAVEGHVREWLAEQSDLPTQELLRRSKERGYTGRKSAFYVTPPRRAS